MTLYINTTYHRVELSTASYDNVSFSVASQDPDPDGFAFNADGTKMYMVGLSNNRVYPIFSFNSF